MSHRNGTIVKSTIEITKSNLYFRRPTRFYFPTPLFCSHNLRALLFLRTLRHIWLHDRTTNDHEDLALDSWTFWRSRKTEGCHDRDRYTAIRAACNTWLRRESYGTPVRKMTKYCWTKKLYQRYHLTKTISHKVSQLVSDFFYSPQLAFFLLKIASGCILTLFFSSASRFTIFSPRFAPNLLKFRYDILNHIFYTRSIFFFFLLNRRAFFEGLAKLFFRSSGKRWEINEFKKKGFDWA